MAVFRLAAHMVQYPGEEAVWCPPVLSRAWLAPVKLSFTPLRSRAGAPRHPLLLRCFRGTYV